MIILPRIVSRRKKKSLKMIGWLLLVIFLALISPDGLLASSDSKYKFNSEPSNIQTIAIKPWYKELESRSGGHVKAYGYVSWPDQESYFQPVGTDTCYDGYAEFRFKNKLFVGKRAWFETHYEAILAGGDTRRKKEELARLYPDLLGAIMLADVVEDDRRLMDLTKIVVEDNNYIVYHRIDRFSLTLQPDWGTICIGRQALSWGNGLLFNPMDLFNPFSPTDIQRDYKIGDDMVTTQFSINNSGDFQFLYVPRKDPATNKVEWDCSSLAAKLHFPLKTTEFDIMGSRHYKDYVAGIGAVGYLKDAAWRLDAVGTFLHKDNGGSDFLSLVANLDYSWVWLEKNFYGLIEYYYNGLGNEQYSNAISDSNLIERLDRGEMFTLGKKYLAAEIQVELHPLFNFYFTVINNLADPSGILQPRAIWDMAENLQSTLGANIYYGKTDTEFGGFPIPGTNYLFKYSNVGFLWLTYFF